MASDLGLRHLLLIRIYRKHCVGHCAVLTIIIITSDWKHKNYGLHELHLATLITVHCKNADNLFISNHPSNHDKISNDYWNQIKRYLVVRSVELTMQMSRVQCANPWATTAYIVVKISNRYIVQAFIRNDDKIVFM